MEEEPGTIGPVPKSVMLPTFHWSQHQGTEVMALEIIESWRITRPHNINCTAHLAIKTREHPPLTDRYHCLWAAWEGGQKSVLGVDFQLGS